MSSPDVSVERFCAGAINILAVAVTLSTGGNLIYRCTNDGCTNANRARVSSEAGATRLSAASNWDGRSVVATTHSDQTLRIHTCSTANEDCIERAVIEDVSFEDGIHAQTTGNGSPVFTFYQGPLFHTARCIDQNCFSVESQSAVIGIGESARPVIAGTLLPAGHPVFAIGTQSPLLFQCADGNCLAVPFRVRVQSNLLALKLRAATVGAEGTLMLVGKHPDTTTIRTFRCANGPACLPYFRPR